MNPKSCLEPNKLCLLKNGNEYLKVSNESPPIEDFDSSTLLYREVGRQLEARFGLKILADEILDAEEKLH